jgi:hypothetical protein
LLRKVDETAVSSSDSAERVRAASTQLRLMLGKDFPVVTRFQSDRAQTVQLAFAESDRLQDGNPLAGRQWLAQMGLVRDACRKLTGALLVGEAVTDAVPLQVYVGQLPLHTDEAWVATNLPNHDQRGRLSLIACSQSSAIVSGQWLNALVVDQWVERIPAPDQLTGIAMHYDAPQSRPPQTMLLAVPPEEGAWTVDDLIETLRDTLAWAHLRAVAPEDLQKFGHHLPAVFGSSTLEPGETA